MATRLTTPGSFPVPGLWEAARRPEGLSRGHLAASGPHGRARHSSWPLRQQVRRAERQSYSQPARPGVRARRSALGALRSGRRRARGGGSRRLRGGGGSGSSGGLALQERRQGGGNCSRTGALPPARGRSQRGTGFFCRRSALELGELILTMKGSKGIENPAFVASSPDTPHRLFASPSHVEVSDLSINTQRQNSQPREPPEPQKSPEPPRPPADPAVSQELSVPESLSEFEEGPCGCGNLKPQSLQRCNTPQGFLLYYCLLALTQGNGQGRAGPSEGEEGRAELVGRRGQVCGGARVVHALGEAAPGLGTCERSRRRPQAQASALELFLCTNF